MQGNVIFHPIISSIQKMNLYETKSNFYVVGTNNTETRFRVLKISRTEPSELHIYDDKVEYTKIEIQNLVSMIESGNRHKSSSAFSNITSAFGIVGFIKFLEGYYIILVTKRRKIAKIGYHTIYKIECTSMIYIPNDSVRLLHPDEPRYYKMFQGIDLSSNFYFSYSYDITHTLQYNLSAPRQIEPTDASGAHNDHLQFGSMFPTPTEENSASGKSTPVQEYGVRTKPHRKFVWNTHLLSKVENDLHSDWIVYVTHGFVSQSNVCVFGKPIYITLIARRSSRYAGTRFLKRGANCQGDVANEVETEQIVHDSGVSSLYHSNISSFVQMRGSIPGHWSQDMGKIVAKPAISIDLYDPFAQTAGAHFGELTKRYGAPIFVLNLVKQREKKKQEALLSSELDGAVMYLNQFLPADHQLIYKPFDMARKNKSNANVMGKLAVIAKTAVMRTGIFYNRPRYFAQKLHSVIGNAQNDTNKKVSLQTGIIRTNCVDCLDRTNTAQFAIGKCVLGYQLCALGILDSPNLDFDTDCVRMLESLYEDHGDTLALQYGGSQLVHRVKTYRKMSPWTSQGNDIMQTLSRYYRNTFSDAEKQNSINLFLGLFVPKENKPPIWDFTSDYYFHHKPWVFSVERPLTQWWETGVFECLPYSYAEKTKACSEIVQIYSKQVEMIDAYSDYHRPYEYSVLSEHYAFKLDNSIRDFMPNCTTNYSAFTIRVRPGKRHEEASKNVIKNPSMTGQSSTSSTASSNSSSTDDSDSSEDDSVNTNDSQSQMTQSRESTYTPLTFSSLFPSMNQTYGTDLKNPKKPDVLAYKNYILMGRRANEIANTVISRPNAPALLRRTKFSGDTSETTSRPVVSEMSVGKYDAYVNIGLHGPKDPDENSLNLYRSYLSMR